MRFYTQQHQFYCGIDLHARTMYLCILNQDGEMMLHRNMKARPEMWLKAIAPYRDDIVVAVACIFTWDWLADLCAREGIPFVLGHALSMKAIHGGKAKNDKIDSQKIAVLVRGGMIPQAYVYPAEMRATRDLLRRRMPLGRKRAELLAHVQNTNSPYNLPEIGKKIAYQANRDGVAERFPAPAVQKSIEVDLALIDSSDQLLTDLELHLVHTAKQPDANTFYRLQSMPGIGKILALVMLYEIHDIRRLPRVQDFASYCRLVKCAKESAGKRSGTSGKKIGNAYLTWAFAAAVVLLLRNNDKGQTYLVRLENKYGKGKAWTVLAHKLARAVYYMLQRDTGLNMDLFLNGSESSAGEPDASLDTSGISQHIWPVKTSHLLRHGTRSRTLALFPDPLRLIGRPLWLLSIRRSSSTVPVGCPCPEPGSHWRTGHVQPLFCRGRCEGTALFLGRRDPGVAFSALALAGDRASIRVWCSHIGGHLCPEITSGHATDARLRRVPAKRKKSKKTARRGSLSLDKGSPHKG